MDNAVISSVDEINNFATLKAVADDIQSRLDEINDKFGYDLQGAFTSAGMDGSSDWRFKLIWQIFQFTMNTKTKELILQMQ